MDYVVSIFMMGIGGYVMWNTSSKGAFGVACIVFVIGLIVFIVKFPHFWEKELEDEAVAVLEEISGLQNKLSHVNHALQAKAEKKKRVLETPPYIGIKQKDGSVEVRDPRHEGGTKTVKYTHLPRRLR